MSEVDKIVRLAISHERRDQPLKREDISKYGNFFIFDCSVKGRLGEALDQSNQILQQSFGLNLIELPAKIANSSRSKTPANRKSPGFALISTLTNEERASLLEFEDMPQMTLLTIILSIIFVNEGTMLQSKVFSRDNG
jgi:hypothetical protein